MMTFVDLGKLNYKMVVVLLLVGPKMTALPIQLSIICCKQPKYTDAKTNERITCILRFQFSTVWLAGCNILFANSAVAVMPSGASSIISTERVTIQPV